MARTEGQRSDLGGVYLEDGIFNPGSVYLDLHSTLRDHLIRESQSVGPTRCTTPSIEGECHTLVGTMTSLPRDEICVTKRLLPGEVEASLALTDEQERMLWVNWLQEVAPWVCWEKKTLFSEIPYLYVTLTVT